MHNENEYTKETRRKNRELLQATIREEISRWAARTTGQARDDETLEGNILWAIEKRGLDPAKLDTRETDPYDREGKPPIRSYPEWERELQRFRRSILEEAGRRFYLCRSIDDIRCIIAELPISEARRIELINLCNVLLRMVLIEDGGQVSPAKLQGF